MVMTPAEREASRNLARKWFEDRKNLKAKPSINDDDSDGLTKEELVHNHRSKRLALSRKKDSGTTKPNNVQNKHSTACAAKDDDTVSSMLSKASTSSIRKLITKVTKPLKRSVSSKESSNKEEQRPLRRSQRKPVPLIPPHRMTTRRSRKVDANVAEEEMALPPAKESTTKKSNCTRKSVPTVELQSLLSPAFGSLNEPFSPTDSLSTTFTLQEVSSATVLEPSTNFSVEEISIIKAHDPVASSKSTLTNFFAKEDDNDHDNVCLPESEESMTLIDNPGKISVDSEDTPGEACSAADPPSAITSHDDENITCNETKVPVEKESAYPELDSVSTDDSAEEELSPESTIEANDVGVIASKSVIFQASTVIFVLVAAVAATIACAGLYSDELRLIQENLQESFSKSSAQIQSSIIKSFDEEYTMINEYFGHVTGTFREILGAETGCGNVGRDIVIAMAGGAYSISLCKAPQMTLTASLVALGACACVMK